MSLAVIREILNEESSTDIEARLREAQREVLAGAGLAPELYDDITLYEEEVQRIEVIKQLTRYYRAILVERLQQEAWDEATDLCLTPELIAMIKGAGYELCEFEGDECEECGGSCVRVWWVRGGYEYPMEGSYYCDKCALSQTVANERRTAFMRKYCDSCHKETSGACWAMDADMDACIEERRFRCPEDRILTSMMGRLP